MYANSRGIRSAQEAPHERLVEQVARHRDHPFRKPVASWNRAAYDEAITVWGGRSPLLLDAGCGVGWSSLQLARSFPDHFVLGVDQSADRLARGKPGQGEWPANLCFVRADLVDFWRLMHDDGVRPERHFILYPNPWPKIGHLARRWHGHAVFPCVVALGGLLESRSNWRIYLDEMAIALRVLSGREPTVDSIEVVEALTPFERKYRDSGQPLYRLVIDLRILD